MRVGIAPRERATGVQCPAEAAGRSPRPVHYLDFPVYTQAERAADGVVHVIGSGAALVAAVWLFRRVGAQGTDRQIFVVAPYVLGLIGTFLASAAYNLAPAGPLKAVLRRIDHIMIFVMIAGTYTPFAMAALPSPLGTPLCATVWALALLGIGQNLVSRGGNRRLAFALYTVMGWLILPLLGPLAGAVSGTVMLLLVVGGIVYSLGSWLHAHGRLPFHNAIWHAMVAIAAALHWCAVVLIMA